MRWTVLRQSCPKIVSVFATRTRGHYKVPYRHQSLSDKSFALTLNKSHDFNFFQVIVQIKRPEAKYSAPKENYFRIWMLRSIHPIWPLKSIEQITWFHFPSLLRLNDRKRSIQQQKMMAQRRLVRHTKRLDATLDDKDRKHVSIERRKEELVSGSDTILCEIASYIFWLHLYIQIKYWICTVCYCSFPRFILVFWYFTIVSYYVI